MPNCNDVVVRYAAVSDAAAVAKYIWQTDEYIYPAAVNSFNEPAWIDLIARSLVNNNSIYFCNRVLVAELQGKVVGLCSFFRCGENVRFALPTNELIRQGIDFIDREYFQPLVAENAERQGVCICNLCVDKYYRGCGVGGKLLDSVFALFPNCDIVLDVIENNLAARSLYEKKGFVVTKSYEGFSGKTDVSVPCLEMVRYK